MTECEEVAFNMATPLRRLAQQPPDFLLDLCLRDIVLAKPVTAAAERWIADTFKEPEKLFWEGQLSIHLVDWGLVRQSMEAHGLIVGG